MDFEISDDGTLIRYSGAGGDVVIPEGVKFIERDGVFDRQTEITTLSLPSTLLGHKHDPLSSRQAHVLKVKPGGQVKLKLYSKANAGGLGNSDAIFELLELDLPSLKNYIVDANNPVYIATDGVLMVKDRFVLDVPKQSHLPFKMECTYQEYMALDASLRTFEGPALWIKFHHKTIFLLALEQFIKTTVLKYNLSNLKVLYFPDATKLGKLSQRTTWMSKISSVIVAPKLEVDDSDSTINHLAILGYGYRPDLYAPEHAVLYQELMQDFEDNLYLDAIDFGFPSIANVYKSLWEQREVSKLIPNNEEQACKRLIEAVLYGSMDDISRVLSYNFSFLGKFKEDREDYTHGGVAALAVACRYGGYDKLKFLLEHEKFNCALNEINQSLVERFKDKISLWQVIGFVAGFAWHIFFYVNADGEIRDLKPIGIDERFKCLDLLAHRFYEPNDALGWMCFYACLMGREELACKLIEQVNFKDFYKKNAVKTGLLAIEEGIRDTLEFSPRNVVILAKAFKDHGCKLPLTRFSQVRNLYAHPEIIRELFGIANVNISHIINLVDHACSNHAKEVIEAVFESGRHFSPQAMQSFLNSATECGDPEIVSFMLDYQSRYRKQDDGSWSRQSLTL